MARKEPLHDSTGREPISIDHDPHIPEKDTRHFAPLPRRPNANKPEMASIMHKYKPEDHDGLPSNVDENPHLRMTRTGETPPPLTTQDVNFTNAQFPHAHIPTYRLFGNVAEVQETVLKRLARNKIILAAVIHGGGQRYIRRSPEKVDEIKSFIKSIDLEGINPRDRAVEVYLPEMRKENDRNRFGQPWTFFVELDENSVALAKYLLWQEVFAIHSALSFSIHPIKDTEEQPWPIIVLTGKAGAVVDTPAAKLEVLASIKTALWANADFCHFAARQVAENWGVHGDIDERVKAASDALDLTCVTAEAAGSERPVPAYLLTGKPVANDREGHKTWIRFFKTAGQYWRGAYCLDVAKAVVDCKLCKEVTHCAWDCPLPKVPGWAGIEPEVVYSNPQVVSNAKTAADGSSRAEGSSSTPATATPSTQAKDIWREAKGAKRGGNRRGGRGARGAGRGARGARR